MDDEVAPGTETRTDDDTTRGGVVSGAAPRRTPDGGTSGDADGGTRADPDSGSGADPDSGSGADPDSGSGADPDSDAGGARPPYRRRRSDRWQPRTALPIALGVALGLVLAEAALAVGGRLRGILTLVLLSLFLSFAIEPAVQWLDQRGVRRGVGTGLVFVGGVALVAGSAIAMSGFVTGEVTALVDAAPTLLDDIAARADELPASIAGPVQDFLEEQADELPARLTPLAGDIGRRVLGVGTTIVGGIFSGLTVALVTFYIVADGPRLRLQLLRRLQPARQRELVHLWELAIAKTGGYVYSRLVLAVVSAAAHLVAFTALDLPYAAALAVWMGVVSSIVPVVGTYLAASVPVVIAIAEPNVSVLWILVVVAAYQQLENYLLQPRITAHTMSLHPAVAFLSVLVGAALLGAVGAILALPAAAIVAALVTTYADEHDVIEHPSPEAARAGRP